MQDNPPRDYVYWTSCVYSAEQLIDELTDPDVSKDVTYETMLKHADGMLEKADELGYDRSTRQGAGITLKSDWSTSFHKSFYCGVPCYYFVYSGIEYIWVKKGHEAEVQACEEQARKGRPPTTSLLARAFLPADPQDNPADLFEDLFIVDSSYFDPDELWGRLMVEGDPACDIVRDNPPPKWKPLDTFSSRRATDARRILESYGIKLSKNLKTIICISQTRNLSCLMTTWCEKYCFGRAQNFCRPPTVSKLLSNFDGLEFLATVPQHIINDVAWAMMTLCSAFGLQNLRVTGIGDFTPGLLRVVDAITAADSGFTVWGFTRKHELALQELPVRDNLVIWASTDGSMSDKRFGQAFDFAAAHGTGLSYATDHGVAYQPRNGKQPEPPWWNPPELPEQFKDKADPVLAELLKSGEDISVIFGYHGRFGRGGSRTTLVEYGLPECPATDPLGGAHFEGACQECYWCMEKPAKRHHADLVEHRLNTIAVIPTEPWQGTRVLLDTGEKV